MDEASTSNDTLTEADEIFLSTPQHVGQVQWNEKAGRSFSSDQKSRILTALHENLDDACKQPGVFEEHFLPALRPLFDGISEKKKGEHLKKFFQKVEEHLPNMDHEMLEDCIDILKHPENKVYFHPLLSG